MRFTISGFWTAIIIVIIMTVLLYVITRSPDVYKFVSPNIIIIISILMVLRIALPFELVYAKNILLPEVLPLINTMVRFPLIEVDGFKITTWMIMMIMWMSAAVYKMRIMIHDYVVIKKSLLVLSGLNKSKFHIVKLVEAENWVSRKITYKISNTYSCPFIFGVLQPIIVLPSVIENFPDNELQMI